MNEIPSIPVKFWSRAQPPISAILVDDMHALMTLDTFKQLAEYSITNPSGAYPGRMWRRYDGVGDMDFRRAGGQPEWLLGWYGFCRKPECPGCENVSTNFRKIIIADIRCGLPPLKLDEWIDRFGRQRLESEHLEVTECDPRTCADSICRGWRTRKAAE